ncbi:MAG: SdrD B-like domain-containing protein, partial [Thermoguttaceae bacterium]
MTLFSTLFGLVASTGTGTSNTGTSAKRRKSLQNRLCRFEEIEPRELLSVNPYLPPAHINIGAVYHEDYVPDHNEDRNGDSFIISWNGGADGTTLDKIVIDLSTGSPTHDMMYFNVDSTSAQGANGGVFPFTLAAENSVTVTKTEVSSDGQKLTIFCDEFTADKQLIFKIDVNLKDIKGVKPLVPGAHFSETSFHATFSSERFEEMTFKGKFIDDYSDPNDLNLKVPQDDYGNKTAANTAGVVKTIEDVQKPRPGSLSGFVYEDMNNNGIRESVTNGESGINGVWLELFVQNEQGNYMSTGLKTQTYLDAEHGAGYYCFNEIPGGKTYRIVETTPENYADGKDAAGTIDNQIVGKVFQSDDIRDIHIGAKEDGINYNFGELKRASLTGTVYHDRNNDGTIDAGEEGIANVIVKLQMKNDADVYVDVPGRIVLTDANGNYRFDNLDPFKMYRIIETTPSGWSDGKDSVGSLGGKILASDVIENIVPKFDEHGVNYNFGEFKKGSISGSVYEDNNNDGIKNNGEKGIGGITVYLCVIDEHGNKINISQTKTAADGSYSFGDLEPGKIYCVTEINPENYCNGQVTPGTIAGNKRGDVNVDVPTDFDQIHNIYIGSEENGINYNFAENNRGVLSGYVYVDANNNGVKNAGETGINGVSLSLWVWREKDQQYVNTTKTTTTNADGYYEFTALCPFNKYQIRETQPTEFLDGKDSVGSLGGKILRSDVLSDIVLNPGDAGTNYNFGELEKINPPLPGSISGYVYVDANNNGVKNAGETGIAGVTISLWKMVNGQYVNTGLTAKTNENGFYRFENLDPNTTYRLVETQPTEFLDGKDSVGSLGGKILRSDVLSDIVLN